MSAGIERRTSKPKRVMIYSSEIAALIDRNPYEEQAKALVKVWTRWFPTRCKVVLQTRQAVLDTVDTPIETRQAIETAVLAETVEKVMSSNEKIMETIESTIQAAPQLIAVSKEKKAEISELVTSSLTAQLTEQWKQAHKGESVDKAKTEIDRQVQLAAPLVQREVTKSLATTSGNQGESRTIDEYSVASRRKVMRDNPLFSKPLGVFDYKDEKGRDAKLDVWLAGRVDGLTDDHSEVVEAKTRQYRLMGRLMEHERLQLLSYLHLTGVEQGNVVERFRDQHRSYPVKFSEDEWQKLVQGPVSDAVRCVLAIRPETDEEDRMAILACKS